MTRVEVARRAFAPGLAIVLAAAGLAAGGAGEPRPVHPIAFDHAAHKRAEIDCSYCHASAATLAGAGMPRIQDCADCHAGIDNDGKEGARIFEFAERGEEPPWPVLFKTSPLNRFSHVAHARRDIGCEVCHGDIGASTRPPERVHQFKMAWCAGCHEEKGAANDCLVCHK